MASGTVGIVRSIRRDTHEVVVETLGSQSLADQSGLSVSRPLLYPKYLGEAPPPHSWVDLTQLQGGIWHVADAGPRADRRVILHDDFNTAHDSNPILFADTEWFLAANPGGLVFQFAPVGGSMGVAYLVTNATPDESTTIYKDAAGGILEQTRGYWFSARMANGPNFNNYYDALVGMSDLAGTDTYFALQSAFGGIATFNAASGGGSTNIVLPTLPDDQVFFWIDMVLVPGQYLAGWINGAGPYLITTDIAPDGAHVAPFGLVHTLINDNKGMFLDVVHMETFAPVAPLSALAIPSTISG